jgi:hypothetical protein
MANRKSNLGADDSQESLGNLSSVDEAADVVAMDAKGLLLATKQGEADIYIHPSTKAEHVRCGWTVTE